MAKEDILYDRNIHEQIKELVKDMLIFEVDYMPDEEIEEVVADVKKLVKIKFYDKNVKIHEDLKKIIKDKVMYDIDDNKYGVAGQTTILIMDKIIGKIAKKSEKKLCRILGIEKEGCLKTTFRAIKNMFKCTRTKRNVLPREDIERLKKMKKTIQSEQKEQPQYVPYRMPMPVVYNKQNNMNRDIMF